MESFTYSTASIFEPEVNKVGSFPMPCAGCSAKAWIKQLVQLVGGELTLATAAVV